MLGQHAVLQKGIHEIWYINENMRRIMVRPVNLAAIHIVTLYIKDSSQVMAHCITSLPPLQITKNIEMLCSDEEFREIYQIIECT